MDANDRRSQLIWSYLSVLDLLKPRAFVMENVKALGALQKWEGTRNLLIHSMRKNRILREFHGAQRQGFRCSPGS